MLPSFEPQQGSHGPMFFLRFLGFQSESKNPTSFNNSLLSRFKFHNILSPISVAAALLEPPANPAPIGIFFFKKILAPKSLFDNFFNRFADLTIKLSLSRLKWLQSDFNLIKPSLLISKSK